MTHQPHPMKSLSIEEQLDLFFDDTFRTHTRNDRTMEFSEIQRCYEDWCEAMEIPPIAGKLKLGVALGKRFFYVNRANIKHWFIEIRPDILEEIGDIDGSDGIDGD